MDIATNTIFPLLAGLLDYPDDSFARRVEQCRKNLSQAYPEIDADALLQLCALPRETLEELFTQTFDITPACVPYVGIHLFGEQNFKRGEFMAKLRHQFQQLKFDPGLELADHLGVLLRFLSLLDITVQKDLVGMCLLSPLQKMIEALGENNPYRAVLQITRHVLQIQFPEVEPAPLPVEQAQGAIGRPCSTPGSGCASAGGQSQNLQL